MAHSSRFESRLSQKLCVGALSAALHIGLFLAIILADGGDDGLDSGSGPSMTLALYEAPEVDRRDGLELPTARPVVSIAEMAAALRAAVVMPAHTLSEELDAQPAHLEFTSPVELTSTAPLAIASEHLEPLPVKRTLVISSDEKAHLSKRLARIAADSISSAQTQLTWEQDGKQYTALLVRERASDGMALERVVAEVSTSDRGRRLTTHMTLNRLAFSQFTQIIDHWDPRVQLHDDEIVGRFHSNTQFNLMYDSRTAPKFLGKVTTAARRYDTQSKGRRRVADIFQGGVETRADPIEMPEELQPFEWAPQEGNARIHKLESDARIRFYADGGYTWRTEDAAATEYVNDPSPQPVYFIAARGATIYVKGTVAGKYLVYSPQRLVIEGDLKYAHDPRTTPDSRDYLGLVCDRTVEIARPSVTGPGDLEIDAAIFAGRRFLVTDIEHPRTATLRIYGSLAAGTISASEPRYATQILYDPRFERRRPPGFPSTNRYEVDDDWDGEWTEESKFTADSTF